jgi:orotidine-5'-phosphate decarboxylase
LGTYRERLRRAAEEKRSVLCIGLDPDAERLRPEDVLAFNRRVIEATSDLVCAYKPNFAFYEQYGPDGWRLLAETRKLIPPGAMAVADAKRGDVAHTNEAYARAIFDVLGFDACTVSPYLGAEALAPFLARKGGGIYVLCRTSNPGGADLQDRQFQGRPLYQVVADMASKLAPDGDVGLVVGATRPAELGDVARAYPSIGILVPGVGAQGGSAADAIVQTGGEPGRVVVNVSRQVLYGDGDLSAEAIRGRALNVLDELRAADRARR